MSDRGNPIDVGVRRAVVDALASARVAICVASWAARMLSRDDKRAQLRIPTLPSVAMESFEGGQWTLPGGERCRLQVNGTGTDLRDLAVRCAVIDRIAGHQTSGDGRWLPILKDPGSSGHRPDGEAMTRMVARSVTGLPFSP